MRTNPQSGTSTSSASGVGVGASSSLSSPASASMSTTASTPPRKAGGPGGEQHNHHSTTPTHGGPPHSTTPGQAHTPPSSGGGGGSSSHHRRTSSRRNKLPALFVLIEQNEWNRVAERARRRPQEAAVWATVRKGSGGGSGGAGGSGSSGGGGGGGGEQSANEVKCKALHHACHRLRSVHSLPIQPRQPNAAAPASNNEDSFHSHQSDRSGRSGRSNPSDEDRRDSEEDKERERDPWVAACRAIVALVEAHPKAAGERESRHGCLPLHLAAFGMSSAAPPPPPPQLVTSAPSSRRPSGGGGGGAPVDLDAVMSNDTDDTDDDADGGGGNENAAERREERQAEAEGGGEGVEVDHHHHHHEHDDDGGHGGSGRLPPGTPRPASVSSVSAPTSPAVDVDAHYDELTVPACHSDPTVGLSSFGGLAVSSSGGRPPRGHGHGRTSSLGSHDMSLMGMSAVIASELVPSGGSGSGHGGGHGSGHGQIRRSAKYEVHHGGGPGHGGGGGRHVRHHSHGSDSAGALTGISGRIDEEIVGGGTGGTGGGSSSTMTPPLLIGVNGSSSGSTSGGGGGGGGHGQGHGRDPPGSGEHHRSSRGEGRGGGVAREQPPNPKQPTLTRPAPLKTSARAQSAPVTSPRTQAGAAGGGIIHHQISPATSINATRRDHHSLLVINALLDAYPRSVKTDSEGGRLPLHTAVSGQATPKVIRTLVRAYPDAARHRTKDGYLPLHLAAHWGVSHPDVVLALLRAYPDAIVGRNRWERTPLEEALVMAGENGRPHQVSLVRALRRHPSYWAQQANAGAGGGGPADSLEGLLSPASAGTGGVVSGGYDGPMAAGRPPPSRRTGGGNNQPSTNLVDVDDMVDDSDDDDDSDLYSGERGGGGHAQANSSHGFMSRMSPRHLLRNKSTAAHGGGGARSGKGSGQSASANAARALAESTDLPTLIRTHAFHSIPHRVERHPAEAAAPINATVRGGYPARTTPLYLICERTPPIEAVEALVEAYPDGTATRKVPGGQLPLHAACTWNASPAVVGHLLAANPAGARTRDDLSNLPLHCACFSGATVDIVESLLCTYPRAVWVPNGQGSAPADIVRRLRHPNRREVLDLIARHEAELAGRQRSKDRSRATARATAEQHPAVEATLGGGVSASSPSRSISSRGRVSQSPSAKKVEVKVSGDDDSDDEGMLWV